MHAQTNEVTDDHHSIEFNFLRITAKAEDLATITAMMEKMGWMQSANPILVNRRIPPSTQALSAQVQAVPAEPAEPQPTVQDTKPSATPPEAPVVAPNVQASTLEPATRPSPVSSTEVLEVTPATSPSPVVAPNPWYAPAFVDG